MHLNWQKLSKDTKDAGIAEGVYVYLNGVRLRAYRMSRRKGWYASFEASEDRIRHCRNADPLLGVAISGNALCATFEEAKAKCEEYAEKYATPYVLSGR